jgi:hypothetical protein
MKTPDPLPPLTVIDHAPSWRISTRQVRAWVTRAGGMIGPVTFDADTPHPVEPYHRMPWADDPAPPAELPTVLQLLRGDFFCAPFGRNDEPFGGRRFPLHGEPANNDWTLEERRATPSGVMLRLGMRPPLLGGKIRKWIALIEGQNILYQRHDLIGMNDAIPLGHHPTLRIPPGAEPGWLSFAPHRFAHTCVAPVVTPERGGRSALRPDTAIEDLRNVPLADGGTTDLTRYPARRGCVDLAILSTRLDQPFGWTAFSLPSLGFAWFSLKNPRRLASTQVWMDHGGRSVAPWSGRNIGCLGLEEATTFFSEGAQRSNRANSMNSAGIATVVELGRKRPTRIPFIQGIVRIAPEFGAIVSIAAKGEDCATLRMANGATIDCEVALKFLEDGALRDLIDE